MDDDRQCVDGDDMLDRRDAIGDFSSISFCFMARLALAMSTVPLIKAAMPVPDRRR